MQRRPLAVDPNQKPRKLQPHERLMFASFGMASMYGASAGLYLLQHQMMAAPDYEVMTTEPVYTAETPDDFFQQMGFPNSPVNLDKERDEYPVKTPKNGHPKCYLKWGAQLYRSNHVIFEMGELYYLVTVDMKQPDKKSGTPWQIDSIVINNGSQKNYIPCDEPKYKHYADRVLAAIATAVTAVNKDADTHATTKQFQTDLLSVIKDLESIATDVKPDPRQNLGTPSKSRPFTP